MKNKKWNTLILIPILFLSLNILSCKTETETEKKESTYSENPIGTESFEIENDSLQKIGNTLIEFSANDFYRNQNPLPIEFRNVEIKYLKNQNKELIYVLCGQFQTGNSDEWIPFTTIITDPYEQWIGSNALSYCEGSKEIPYSKKDFSAELKNKLNSLIETQK